MTVRLVCKNCGRRWSFSIRESKTRGWITVECKCGQEYPYADFERVNKRLNEKRIGELLRGEESIPEPRTTGWGVEY